MKGYCVAWGGDVSGHLVERDGYYYAEGDFNQETGIAKLPAGTVVTQELRQQQWDDWTFTYDHVMLIYGIAKDKAGNKYYMVKNSWGTQYGRNGIWYMSEDYIKLNTTYLFLCKDAIKKKMLNK